MLAHYEWKQIDDNGSVPESHHIKIQENPGKCFLIKKMRDITNIILKSNMYDEATPPTDCATFILDGKTHYISLRIPVSQDKFDGITTNVVFSNAMANKQRYRVWKIIFLFIMDKNSMYGRPFWAWFKHRVEEGRKE